MQPLLFPLLASVLLLLSLQAAEADISSSDDVSLLPQPKSHPASSPTSSADNSGVPPISAGDRDASSSDTSRLGPQRRRHRKSKQRKGSSAKKSSAKKSSSSSTSVETFRVKHVSHSGTSGSFEGCQYELVACRAQPGHAAFFVGRDVIVDEEDGVREHRNLECRCKHGKQYSFAAINPEYDISDLGTAKGLAVGRLRCADQAKLCVESSFGVYYHGKSGETVDLIPVPFTNKEGKTRMFMTIRPRLGPRGEEESGSPVDWKLWARGYHTGESFANEAVFRNGTFVRRLNFDEFTAIPIIGVDCGGCRRPLRYCDRAIKKTYAR